MKQLFIALVILSFSYKSVPAQTAGLPQPKLSAATKQFLWNLEKQQPGNPTRVAGFVYKQDAQNTIYASAIIKVYPGFSASALTALGVHINTKAGNIWTAQVPLNEMNEFVKISGIQYIEMDEPTFPALDSARRVTHVDSVQKGYGLPHGYSGKNVIVGVVDEGFDYTHPTLYDTLYKNYRVQRVWEEKNTSGPAPTELGFSYGTEFTDSSSILARGQDGGGIHGTHVMGIATGSGYGSKSNDRFRGMAYGSDVVLVGINPVPSYWLTTSMTDMIDGINYIYKYAASVSKPAVVNLSWGCPLGPRDGTSLFSQALDNLTGPGKIFVISAGNNGADIIHLKKTFSVSDSIVNTFVTFPSGGTDTSIVSGNMIDIWGDSAQTFCIKFSLYDSTRKTDSSIYYCLDDLTHNINLVGLNKDTFSVILTTVASEFNGKSHMLLQLSTSFTNTAKVRDSLCITLKSTNASVNMWQGYVLNNDGYYGSFLSNGYSWAVSGDSISSISDLTTSKSAITVGAYDSKVSFINAASQSLYYPGFSRGTIAKFSSLGPTADGRTEPNITGPGMAVASSINSFDSSYLKGGSNYVITVSSFVSALNNRTYSYVMEQGTSMSSPAVTGIVALLLEADPTLSPQDVMTILDETAITDKYTGTIPTGGSNTWGYGKVNAYQAIKKAIEKEGIFHLASSTLTCLVYPNPSDGNYAVEFVAERNENLVLSVFDISGKQLVRENWQVTPGDNLHEFNLSSLPAGIYLTQIQGMEGISTIKIVKQ